MRTRSPRSSTARPAAGTVALLLGLGLFLNQSCSDSDPAPPVGSASFGAGGGVVQVDTGALAGTRLVVPANAIPDQVAFQIFADGATSVSGLAAIGPAARFEPDGTSFAVAATAVLVFDPASVPAGTQETDILVERRDGRGALSQLTPSTVDLTAGTAAVQLTSLSTYWVVVVDHTVTPVNYFPLNDGNRYVYDTGLTVELDQTTTEPNLGGRSVMRLRFNALKATSGIYLRRTGAIESLGTLGGSFQELYDDPVTFLPQTATLGEKTESGSAFDGYQPYGATTSTYTGQVTETVTVESRGPLTVPLKTFSDVIQVEYVHTWIRSTGQSGSSTDVIWYARNVGPVQVLLDGSPLARLVSGSVGGWPIR